MARTKPKLALRACTYDAWNTNSGKYLKHGIVDGQKVQLLIYMGCDQSLVLVRN